jgi:hypothetical protein
VQGWEYDESDAVIVTTRLMHSSGQWVEASGRMKPMKNDPQGVGSAITYARRYGLQAIAGIPAEDDDGNAATRGNANGHADHVVTGEQLANLVALIEEAKPNREKFFAHFKIAAYRELKQSQYSEAVRLLEGLRSKAAK